MYKDFSSLPPEQEAQFAVFEQHSREAASAANKMSLIISGALFVVITAIVLGFWGPIHPPTTADGEVAAETE